MYSCKWFDGRTTGDTREEKVFRMWINSLAIDNGDLYINNLFSDVQNGSAILKVGATFARPPTTVLYNSSSNGILSD